MSYLIQRISTPCLGRCEKPNLTHKYTEHTNINCCCFLSGGLCIQWSDGVQDDMSKWGPWESDSLNTNSSSNISVMLNWTKEGKQINKQKYRLPFILTFKHSTLTGHISDLYHTAVLPSWHRTHTARARRSSHTHSRGTSYIGHIEAPSSHNDTWGTEQIVYKSIYR